MPTNTQRITTLEAWKVAHDAKHAANPLHAHTAPPIVVPTYTFQDEFEGTALSPKWVSQYGPGDPGDRLDTDMSAPLMASQVSVANSIATIVCERKATPSGRPFAGACISTYGTFSQKYGTFEARLRYDEAERTWPALWLLPVGQKGPYPEVDWVEAYGSPGSLGPGQIEHIVHHTPPPYVNVLGKDYIIKSVSPGWHTHKMIWTPTRIDFFIDGIASWSFTDAARVPQVAMYPIVTFGVDPRNATGPAPDRTTLDLDWLRVSP